MKTKFTAVVKIKKRKVEDIENSIFAVDGLISATKAQIESAVERYNSLEPPKEGTFANIILFEDMKKAFRREIESLRQALAMHINKKNSLLASLKIANLEYEKMKHLEEEEKLKIVKAMAAKEAKNLDEIGVMLYNNRSED